MNPETPSLDYIENELDGLEQLSRNIGKRIQDLVDLSSTLNTRIDALYWEVAERPTQHNREEAA